MAPRAALARTWSRTSAGVGRTLTTTKRSAMRASRLKTSELLPDTLLSCRNVQRSTRQIYSRVMLLLFRKLMGLP